MNRAIRFLVLSVVFTFGFSTARAAEVFWTTSGSFTTNAVQLTNNLVYAVDVGSSSAVDDTSTGVVFGADNGADLLESATHGVSNSSGFLPSGTTGDSAFNSVLNSADFPSNFTDPIVYTLENLTVGQSYEVELLLADTRPGFNGRFFTASQTGGGSPTIVQTYGFANGSPVVGGYAIGVFTANSTTQSFQLLSSDAPPPVNDGNLDVGGQLNALILTTVPEPGSLLLVLAGGIVIVCRRSSWRRAIL
jgi:hypothetical protein